eukprot:1486816-Rhodomonas_salina.4
MRKEEHPWYSLKQPPVVLRAAQQQPDAQPNADAAPKSCWGQKGDVTSGAAQQTRRCSHLVPVTRVTDGVFSFQLWFAVQM